MNISELLSGMWLVYLLVFLQTFAKRFEINNILTKLLNFERLEMHANLQNTTNSTLSCDNTAYIFLED